MAALAPGAKIGRIAGFWRVVEMGARRNNVDPLGGSFVVRITNKAELRPVVGIGDLAVQVHEGVGIFTNAVNDPRKV